MPVYAVVLLQFVCLLSVPFPHKNRDICIFCLSTTMATQYQAERTVKTFKRVNLNQSLDKRSWLIGAPKK